MFRYTTSFISYFLRENKLKNNMKIEVHLISQSKAIDHTDVINAYIKNSMYCLLFKDKSVYKYPMVNIFRVIEKD